MEQFTSLRDAEGKADPGAIRRAAAMLGPGFRGERANLTEQEWNDKARELQLLWQEAALGDIPGYLKSRTEWKDRRAKLFEIGEYDDKGLRISQTDLQSLAANFETPTPILIEHVENPLRLGYLTQVSAVGGELFGMLALTPEADSLLESTGAKSLSLSVSRDMTRIFEVSIVGNPRVESARLFCGDFRSDFRFPISDLRNGPRQLALDFGEHETPSTSAMLRVSPEDGTLNTARVEGVSGGGFGEWRSPEGRRSQDIDDEVENFVRRGVILPASREAAVRLLLANREVGIAFLNSLPAKHIFGEIAPQPKRTHQFGGEEAEFYRRHFPDIPVEEIAKRKEETWQR